MKGEEAVAPGDKGESVREGAGEPPRKHTFKPTFMANSDWHQKETWRDHFINVAVIRGYYLLYYKFTFWPRPLSERIASRTNLFLVDEMRAYSSGKEWAGDDSAGDYSLWSQDYTWWISPFQSKVLSIFHMLATILYTSLYIPSGSEQIYSLESLRKNYGSTLSCGRLLHFRSLLVKNENKTRVL